MEFIEYDIGMKTYIRPSYEDDLPLFKHCSGGSISVTKNQFYEVMSILKLHGVDCFSWTKEE